MWATIKTAISKAAPLVGSLIGGPLGASAGALVANALGVENTPNAISHALNSDPDALIKIKQMELDHEVELKQLQIDEMSLQISYQKAQLADTQDARKQHKEHWMPWTLTLILALMVSGMFAALFLGKPPEQYSQVLIMISGTVLGAFGTAVAFWLGSSQGSVTKGKQLEGGKNVR